MIIQIILAVLCVGLIFLSAWLWDLLQKKQKLDLESKAAFEANLDLLKSSLEDIQIKLADTNEVYENTRREHFRQMTNWEVQAATAETTARLNAKAETERLRAELQKELIEFTEEVGQQKTLIDSQLKNYREQVESILEPMQTLARSEAARKYYCLDLSEKDNSDIQYLVENVAPKLANSAIIPKLCWSEYVSKAFADLVNKTGIKDEPGIYKITNINTNKSYIGKATSCKKRLSDHLKGACGMTTVADQQIHHAIVEEGFNNWTFEVICYCEKEQLNERERFYIAEFHGLDWGYNRNAGGGG